MPRPHLPGDPPLRRADPALHTPAARRTARSLGRQLHTWWEAQGLTQQQASARIGWDQPHWARLEAGHVFLTLDTLALVASRSGLRIVLTPDSPGATGTAATPGVVITLEALWPVAERS